MSWTLAPSGPRGATLTNESTVDCAHDSRSTRDPLEIHSRSTRIELGFEYEWGNVAREERVGLVCAVRSARLRIWHVYVCVT
jgi:hypothetical protein